MRVAWWQTSKMLHDRLAVRKSYYNISTACDKKEMMHDLVAVRKSHYNISTALCALRLNVVRFARLGRLSECGPLP